MSGFLIEAALWQVAPEEWRYEATARIDGGRIVQIGAWEAVAYGLDDCPRLRAPEALALPLAGGLKPGACADLVLVRADADFSPQALLAWFRGGELQSAAPNLALDKAQMRARFEAARRRWETLRGGV